MSWLNGMVMMNGIGQLNQLIKSILKRTGNRTDNKRHRQYQNERNQRPEIKANNRDCERNKIANKNQKLAKEREKNTKIFI